MLLKIAEFRPQSTSWLDIAHKKKGILSLASADNIIFKNMLIQTGPGQPTSSRAFLVLVNCMCSSHL